MPFSAWLEIGKAPLAQIKFGSHLYYLRARQGLHSPTALTTLLWCGAISVRSLQALVKPHGDRGNSVLAGFATEWEARVAVRSAELQWPADASSRGA